MAKGLFLVGREMFDHPVVGIKKPHWFSAWVWLLGSAQWKAKDVEINGQTVWLSRGQLSFSVRFMAVKFGMSVKGVRIFLERLEREKMIYLGKQEDNTSPKRGTAKGKGQNIITICNYDTYQDYEKYRAQLRATQGQGKGKVGAQRRTPEGIPEGIPDILGDANSFDDWFSFYPKKTGKADAHKAYISEIKNKKVTHEKLMEGLKKYCAFIERDKTETKWIKGPAAWIRAGKYKDDYSEIIHEGATNKPKGNGNAGVNVYMEMKEKGMFDDFQ